MTAGAGTVRWGFARAKKPPPNVSTFGGGGLFFCVEVQDLQLCGRQEQCGGSRERAGGKLTCVADGGRGTADGADGVSERKLKICRANEIARDVLLFETDDRARKIGALGKTELAAVKGRAAGNIEIFILHGKRIQRVAGKAARLLDEIGRSDDDTCRGDRIAYTEGGAEVKLS